jgi:hypothetical protein
MRSQYSTGQRHRFTAAAKAGILGETGGWAAARAGRRQTRRFDVEAYEGRPPLLHGMLRTLLLPVFIGSCRAIFGKGLDPEHLE